jgi:hypothetical protein
MKNININELITKKTTIVLIITSVLIVNYFKPNLDYTNYLDDILLLVESLLITLLLLFMEWFVWMVNP